MPPQRMMNKHGLNFKIFKVAWALYKDWSMGLKGWVQMGLNTGDGSVGPKIWVNRS